MQESEIHDAALYELVNQVHGKLLVAELLIGLKKLDVPGWIDFDQFSRLAQLTAQTIDQGRQNSAIFTGVKAGD